MAEVVQLHIEDLLDGFKCLEDEGIFTADEVTTIVKNIRNHEYKLQRTVKEKENNLKYINYLQCVLQLMQKKYDQMDVHANEDVRHMFIKKIKTEFRKLRDRHQRDVKIWLSFINFCKRNKHKDYVSKLYNRMLQVLPDKPELWILSAKWYLEEQNSWDLARNSFNKGLRFNPKSPDLFIEFFRFELLYAETVIKRKKLLSEENVDDDVNNPVYELLPESHIENDSILNGKIALVIFKRAIEQIGLEYVLEFLDILDHFSSYSFSKDLKIEILNHLKANYNDSEETWSILARSSALETDNQTKKFKTIDEEYHNALDRFQNEKMWSLYLDNLISNLKSNLGEELEQECLKKLKDELGSCIDKGLIAKSTFIRLIDELAKISCPVKYFQEIVKLGKDKWDNDINIWHHYIKLLIKNNETKTEIQKPFNKVLNIVPNQLENDQAKKTFFDFLRVFTEWAINNLNEKELIKILKTNSTLNLSIKDLNLSRSIATYFKPILLEQVSTFNNGQTKCRQLFDKYKLMNPIVKEFYTKMIELERNDFNNVDVKFVRKLYNEMLGQFGKNDHKLWLDFCEFELKHGSYVEITRIYEIAKKQLNPTESDLFVQNYSLLNKKCLDC